MGSSARVLWALGATAALVDVVALVLQRYELVRIAVWHREDVLSGFPVLLYLWFFPQVVTGVSAFVVHKVRAPYTGPDGIYPLIRYVCLRASLCGLAV